MFQVTVNIGFLFGSIAVGYLADRYVFFCSHGDGMWLLTDLCFLLSSGLAGK